MNTANLEKMVSELQATDAARAAAQVVKADTMMAVGAVVIVVTMLVVAFTLKRAWSR